MISLEYIATSLVVVLLPGTGVLFTVATGITLGRRASLFAALGCTLGILPHMLAATLGLTVLLHVGAIAFQILKLAGALYLLYLAYGIWRSRDDATLQAFPVGANAFSLVLKAFLVNILNPKLLMFFLAYLPQFASSEAASTPAQILVLGVVFMAITFLVFVLYGLLADLFRRHVTESRRVRAWLRNGFAVAFAGLGVKLALSDG